MKVVKSNSKTQYNFCGTNKLNFKERVLAGNSFVPTKRDMSVDVREPGNSYVDEKVDMADTNSTDSNQSKPRVGKLRKAAEFVGKNWTKGFKTGNQLGKSAVDKGTEILNKGTNEVNRLRDKATTAIDSKFNEIENIIDSKRKGNQLNMASNDEKKKAKQQCIDNYVKESGGLISPEEAKWMSHC